MVENQNKRHQISREKKASDDLFNKLSSQIKSESKIQKRLIDQSQNLEEPFYDRLRLEDKLLEEKERKQQQDRRVRLSFAASHSPSGQCILSILKMADLEKRDEKKAARISRQKNQEE